MNNAAMTISIDEVKQLKQKLETDIHALLDKFQRTTGVFPGKIYLETVTMQTFGKPDEQRITHCHVACELS